jgi:hypothetical protein
VETRIKKAILLYIRERLKHTIKLHKRAKVLIKRLDICYSDKRKLKQFLYYSRYNISRYMTAINLITGKDGNHLANKRRNCLRNRSLVEDIASIFDYQVLVVDDLRYIESGN